MSFLNGKHGLPKEGQGTITLERGRVRYSAWGDVNNPSVIYIHGFLAGDRTYQFGLAALAAMGYRVFAPSLPGFATSTALRWDHSSYSDYARWTKNAVSCARSLGIISEQDSYPILGHSFGGGVAVKAVHKFPEDFDGLGIINGVPGYSVIGPRGRPWQVLPCEVARIGYYGIKHGHDDFLETFRGESSRVIARLKPPAVGRAMYAMLRSDLKKELHELGDDPSTRAAVIWCNDDILISRLAFEEQVRALNVEGIVLRNGHLWMLGQPERFGLVLHEALLSMERPPLRPVDKPVEKEVDPFDEGLGGLSLPTLERQIG